MEESFSTFIKNYTTEINGKQSIDIVKAFIELYARLKTAQLQIKEVQEALGDYAAYLEKHDDRILKLEGGKKIEIVTPEQAKLIMK